ncbi:hypothetical protein PSHT_01378 [Puccinia striiformis]|uniref:Uncharacterized protein n=1 Tax=Puccinia striiformis TaxID=27350 RepID=A0A2S4WKL2_9BASI|nr:hypothetical protein PSHT_01378 [Puccinia striiformis]
MTSWKSRMIKPVITVITTLISASAIQVVHLGVRPRVFLHHPSPAPIRSQFPILKTITDFPCTSSIEQVIWCGRIQIKAKIDVYLLSLPTPTMSDAAANGASEELKQALSLDSLFGLKGLVAVVTGGGTGYVFLFYPCLVNVSRIGLMCTQALAAHGARDIISFFCDSSLHHGKREEVLKQAVDNYHKHAKGEIIGLQADVTNKADLEKIIGEIQKRSPTGYKFWCVVVLNITSG